MQLTQGVPCRTNKIGLSWSSIAKSSKQLQPQFAPQLHLYNPSKLQGLDRATAYLDINKRAPSQAQHTSSKHQVSHVRFYLALITCPP